MDALVSETTPSLAFDNDEKDNRSGFQEPALPAIANASTPRRSSPRWFQVARFQRKLLPGIISAACVPDARRLANCAARNEPKFGVAISISFRTCGFGGGESAPDAC